MWQCSQHNNYLFLRTESSKNYFAFKSWFVVDIVSCSNISNNTSITVQTLYSNWFSLLVRSIKVWLLKRHNTCDIYYIKTCTWNCSNWYWIKKQLGPLCIYLLIYYLYIFVVMLSFTGSDSLNESLSATVTTKIDVNKCYLHSKNN